MKLIELINNLKVIQAIGDLGKIDIGSIEYDSRKVNPGSLFVAIKGFLTDGHKYIDDAINKGAVAIVVEDMENVKSQFQMVFQVPIILVKDSRKALAFLSNLFYNSPSDRIKLIGVTGTNGKTSSTFIIKEILQNAGYNTGLIGTISYYINQRKLSSDHTTPESKELCKLLDMMVREKCEYCVMEVSSHSLALSRVEGLNYKAALFTNLTQDHLDFHNDFNTYFDAKKKLFDSLKKDAIAISNFDNEYGKKILSDTLGKKVSYGENIDYDYSFRILKYDFNSLEFSLKTKNGDFKIKSNLTGKFNFYNLTGAIALCIELGIDIKTIINAVEKINTIDGRFQIVDLNSPLKVLVDYSHTPDALENCLISIRDILAYQNNFESKIITCFGAGGDRDKLKRPIMGSIVEKLSDLVIITSDNPRNENPEDIIEAIYSGIKEKNRVVKITSREDAIQYAIDKANEKDIILIAGKGHENYQEVKGIRSHFSDKEVAQKYLTERFNK